MAIDRDEITKSIFKDSQQPARSFVSPVVAGYRENTIGAAGAFKIQANEVRIGLTMPHAAVALLR